MKDLIEKLGKTDSGDLVDMKRLLDKLDEVGDAIASVVNFRAAGRLLGSDLSKVKKAEKLIDEVTGDVAKEYFRLFGGKPE